jgi:ABC-type Fe3+-hydroxamate transport system substrate-binding protein
VFAFILQQTASMLFSTDQLRDVPISFEPPAALSPTLSPPRRIISLVPSLTELLFDLGLDEEVVGITKFCVHPKHGFRTKRRVGGTKNINAGIIHELQPDLIVANKEENLREEVEKLALHYAVWVTDIQTLKDALEMIRVMGHIADREQKAESMAQTIEAEFRALEEEFAGKNIGRPSEKDADQSVQTSKPVSPSATAYLIWRDPYMVAGGDTFIHEMMKSCRLRNVFADRNRYPVITIEELRAAGCEYILLSSEPYPFKEKHVEELQKQLPAARILLADGEMFSWYGSRMLKAPAYFRRLWDRMARPE